MNDFVGQKFGNYRLVRLLGQGGFADTYLGEQMYLKTEAAIKIVQTQLAQSDQEGFYSEARTIVHMKHPNIVRLLEFGVESSRNIPYLVMDYAPHGTLRQRHRRGEPLPIALVLSYVKQIAAALQYAHEHKVIHRDVKPENMLVGENNEILLSDFGIAVVQNTRSQLPQTIAGTMTYMAPEQIQGQPTAASDQYALAVAAYEWLCGVAPFIGSYAEVAIQHERVSPMPLRQRVPTIPAEMEHIVLTALAKDQNRRFGSVQAFAVALEQAVRVSPSSPLSPSALSADSQMYLPTERTPQRNTPPVHSGYGIPPASAGMLPSYGSQPPYGEHPSAPPPPPPVAQNPIIPTVTDPFGPKITPQFIPLPSSDPQQNAYTPQHAQSVQPQSLPQTVTGPARNPSQPRSSTTMIIVLAAALLLIVGGSAFAYAGVYLPHQRQVQATATVNAQLTGTAQAYANATATQTALMNVYTQATSGIPIISDPLHTPDNYGWAHTNDSSGTCDFVDGAYHSRVQVGYDFYPCYANATNFTDFAFQVEMTIISGSGGGIVFGVSPGALSAYHFYVATDGTYYVYQLTYSSNGWSTRPLRSGFSPAIHTGLNQTNLIAVVTRGSNFYFYVNKKYIDIASDNSYKSGEIGVVANSGNKSGTEVVFRNVQVWQPQVAVGDLYTQATHGTPTLNDQLQAQTSSNWDVRNPAPDAACEFSNGLYHLKVPGGGIINCLAKATNFTNLAFQVEMRIISGHSGGLVIRSDADHAGYFFRISTDGTFLAKSVTVKQHIAYGTPLFAGQSPAVHIGNDQFNQVTVIAKDNEMYMYINQQYVAKVSDDTYQSGSIGVYADSDASSSEIVFRNAQVWKL